MKNPAPAIRETARPAGITFLASTRIAIAAIPARSRAEAPPEVFAAAAGFPSCRAGLLTFDDEGRLDSDRKVH
jgi:hypothetical protein